MIPAYFYNAIPEVEKEPEFSASASFFILV